jgi:hypothetical protein
MYNKYFLHLDIKAEMERLAYNGDELQNAEYLQIYVAYVLFFKTFILPFFQYLLELCMSNNGWCTSSGTSITVGESRYRLCMSEMPPCSNEKLSHQKVMGAYFRIVYFVCVLSTVQIFIICNCKWFYASINLATNSDYLKHLIMQSLCYNMRLGSVSIHFKTAQHRLPEIDGQYFQDTTSALTLRDNIHSYENIS